MSLGWQCWDLLSFVMLSEAGGASLPMILQMKNHRRPMACIASLTLIWLIFGSNHMHFDDFELYALELFNHIFFLNHFLNQISLVISKVFYSQSFLCFDFISNSPIHFLNSLSYYWLQQVLDLNYCLHAFDYLTNRLLNFCLSLIFFALNRFEVYLVEVSENYQFYSKNSPDLEWPD